MKFKPLFLLPFFAISFLHIRAQSVSKIKTTSFRKDTLNILKYGAVADGWTLNTKAINDAINAIHKKGGGVVFVPAGIWLTGPIELKSNVNLHLAKNALIQSSPDFDQYKLLASNWEGLPQMRNQSPVYATNCTNIAITGHGIIDGNGDAWRMVKKDKLNETQWKKLLASGGKLSDDKKTWYPSEKSVKGSKLKNPGEITPDKTAAFYDEVKDFLRPNLLVLTQCKRILLEGVTFQNSPAWCLHPLMSEDIIIRNITVKNPWYAQNGDGLDLESCKNVLIEGSSFDVGDDGICIKSGRDEAGRKRGMPTENVWVRNCTVYHAHGGFVIGSEMSGGARNIWVNDCTFIGTDIGLRFKTTRGRGGIVENIFISNITMKDIVGEAILFDMYYAAQDPIPLAGEERKPPKVETQPVTDATPQFRKIYVNNVACNGAAKAIFVRGLPEMNVQDIVLSDMTIQAVKGLDCTEGLNIQLKNVKLITKETDPVMNIHNSKMIVLDKIGYSNDAALLLNITGEKSEKIQLKNTDASKAKKKVEFNYGASEKAMTGLDPVPSPLAKKWSEQISETVMKLWPDSFLLESDKVAKWRYDQGVILKGIRAVWAGNGDGKWFNYIQKSMDFYLNADGSIKGYKPDEYNIDHINNGKLLLFLFQVTGKEKYKNAADLLREQLRTHPRTSEGGFWHKKIYPSQMWLDGLYMAQPFYAEYAKLFHEDTIFNDVARQFILMEKHAMDKKTGLLYHGWDESKEQEWANKTTGQSPNFWARSLGWFGMALIDVLDQFPADHPKRTELIAILNRFAEAVKKVQDSKTGLWYDVPNLPNEPKNYREASASCMLTYTFAKGTRKGYLSNEYMALAKKAYDGIIKEFIETNSNGQVNLKGTVAVSGLGGKPYRDGSFGYYMSEPVIVNDPKGIGAFIKCAAEMELNETRSASKTKTVLLDYYFNNEWKNDITGRSSRWHYNWEDKTNSGFAMLGDIFGKYGMKTRSLEKAPTKEALKNASVYIIVDPDTEKETQRPNFIAADDITAISDWVKNGGVLVLLGNDAGNAEFKNFNRLAGQFGIQFNEDSKNRVQNDQFEDGVVTTGVNPIFRSNRKLYVKEYSSLAITAPAVTVVKKGEDNVIAIAEYGKGTVFAMGDPWVYNEYVDGRKLPGTFENYKAAEDLVQWLIKQSEIK